MLALLTVNSNSTSHFLELSLAIAGLNDACHSVAPNLKRTEGIPEASLADARANEYLALLV